MARRSEHPDKELFEYLNGTLDEAAARIVEDHLKGCANCTAAANTVRELKSASHAITQSAASPSEISDSQISNFRSQTTPAHPDVGELASLFYGGLARARSSSVRAHVASCPSCAAELAQYARADRVAAEYKASPATAVEIPARAWEMINEWEESSFAKPKQAGASASGDMLLRLSEVLLSERDRLREQAEGALAGDQSELAARAVLVPVIVVDRTGEFRGVELFEREGGPGAGALRHAQGSERFNNRPFHALLDFGKKKCVTVSDLIQRDTIRLVDVPKESKKLRRVDYFIVED